MVWPLAVANELTNNRNEINFNSPIGLSRSSKVQRFLSRQRSRIMQEGIIPHKAAWWDFQSARIQQASRSTTRAGITQCKPNRQNIIDQRPCAASQCKRKWSVDSPLDLHIQHQSTIIISLLRRLSTVKILPSVAIHMKKCNSRRDSNFPDALLRERGGLLDIQQKSTVEAMNLKTFW